MLNKIQHSLKQTSFGETISHSLNYLIGSSAVKGLSILSIPIMTRLLTTEDYGILNIFAAYTSLLAILIPFNLNVSISRYYFEKAKTDFNEFLGTAVLLPYLFFMICGVLFLIFNQQIADLINLPLITVYFLIPVAMIDFIGTVHLQIFRASKKSNKVKSLQIINGYAAFLFSITLIYFWDQNCRYEGKLYANLIMLAITSSLVLYRIWPLFKIKVKLDHLKYMFSYSVPLLPAYLSSFLLAQVDRVMIGNMIDNAEAGQYSFAYNISMLQVMIANALLNAWSPRYYELMNKDDHAHKENEFLKILGIISFLTIGLILFADYIGYVLGSKSFHQSLFLIPVIVFGNYFISAAPIYKWNISFEKKTFYTTLIILGAALVNVVLNYIYIPVYGSIAGAFTTLISFFIQFVLTYLVARFFLKTPLMNLKQILPVIAIVGLACVYYYLELYYIDTAFVLSFFGKVMVLVFLSIALLSICQRNLYNRLVYSIINRK